MYNGVYTIEQYAYMNDTLTKWLVQKVNDSSLGNRLMELGVNHLAIYGVGGVGTLVYQDIKKSEVKIHSFIDKYAKKYPTGVDELPVLSLEQLGQLDRNCYVLVTPEFFFRDILMDLLKGGIPLERIISLAMVV